MKTGCFRQLHAGIAHAARCTEDENGLASLNLTACMQHAIGRAISARQAGRILIRHVVWQFDELAGAHDAIFRHGAVAIFAEHVELAVVPIDMMRNGQYAISDPPAVYASSQRINVAGTIHAGDPGQFDLDPRHAASGKEISMVETRRTNANAHPSIGHVRHRPITVAKDRKIAVFLEIDSFHETFLALKPIVRHGSPFSYRHNV